jgi:hypothetical protein
VLESKTADLDQSKVAASQRFPISLTGMLLFNAFMNGRNSGGAEYPVVAGASPSAATDGATVRQTILGLKFNGPDLPGGGKASGSIYMDFFGGTSDPYNNLLRIRTAALDLSWKNTTVTVGQDKPIISPREPTSFAQVGISPLTGRGQSVGLESAGARRTAIFLRREHGAESPGGRLRDDRGLQLRTTGRILPYARTFAPRLAGPVRILPWRRSPAVRSRAGIQSQRHPCCRSVGVVEDRIARLADSANAAHRVLGRGLQRADVGGFGALPGFDILPSDLVIPVHSHGEWGQIALFPASRLSAHIYAGEQSNRASDIAPYSVQRNFTYAGNIMYKLAPNVVAALEAAQTRTEYLGSLLRLNNHYDLALAYLF